MNVVSLWLVLTRNQNGAIISFELCPVAGVRARIAAQHLTRTGMIVTDLPSYASSN